LIEGERRKSRFGEEWDERRKEVDREGECDQWGTRFEIKGLR